MSRENFAFFSIEKREIKPSVGVIQTSGVIRSPGYIHILELFLLWKRYTYLLGEECNIYLKCGLMGSFQGFRFLILQ
jgi:hypothetical protein